MVSPPVSPTNTTASVQVVVRLRPLNEKEKKNVDQDGEEKAKVGILKMLEELVLEAILNF